MATCSGRVAWFNTAKGYGFIKREGESDLFVHHSSIVMEGYRTLHEGDGVDFEVIMGSTGKPQADHVVKRASSLPA